MISAVRVDTDVITPIAIVLTGGLFDEMVKCSTSGPSECNVRGRGSRFGGTRRRYQVDGVGRWALNCAMKSRANAYKSECVDEWREGEEISREESGGESRPKESDKIGRFVAQDRGESGRVVEWSSVRVAQSVADEISGTQGAFIGSELVFYGVL